MTETPAKLSTRDLRPAQRELSGVVVKKVAIPGETEPKPAVVAAPVVLLSPGESAPAGASGTAAAKMDSDTDKPGGKLRERPIDLGLVEAAQAGNPDALNQVIIQSEPKVFAYLRHHFKGSQEDISDLSQEILTRIASRLSQFRNTGKPFEAWLLTVTTNQLRDVYRAQGRPHITTESLDEGYDDPESGPRAEPAAADDTAAEAVGEISRTQLLARLREGLTSKQFQVLILKTKKFTNAEIARRLSMGEEGVKQLYYRAQENARKIALGEAIDDPSEAPPKPEPAPQRLSLGTITNDEGTRAGLGPRQRRILELVEQGQDLAGVRRALGSSSNTTDGSLVDSYVNGAARVLRARGDKRAFVEIKREVAEANPLRPEKTGISQPENTDENKSTPAQAETHGTTPGAENSPHQAIAYRLSENPDFPVIVGQISDDESMRAKLGTKQMRILELAEQGYDLAAIRRELGSTSSVDIREAYRGGVAKLLKARGDRRSLGEIKSEIATPPSIQGGSGESSGLTERQKTAVELKAQGLSDYEIARLQRPVVITPEAATTNSEGQSENGFQVPISDIRNWLSVTATLAQRTYEDNPDESNANNLRGILNRISAFDTLAKQAGSSGDESRLRAIFSPELEQISKLREYSKAGSES